MKCSESWLRQWVNPKLKREQLAEKLTMSGIEVEDIQPVAEDFHGVVIGQVVGLEPHPDAENLKLCEVKTKSKTLQIVCGAQNVKLNQKVPVAVIGAKLPNNIKIQSTTIRGAESQGMICSASELGLITKEAEGILVLPSDAPLGEDVWDYLALEDFVFDVSITPNRGDCLSIKGLSREISALTNAKVKEVKIPKIKPKSKKSVSVQMKLPAGCPRYVARVIQNVKADLQTPAIIAERLRRAGVRSISPIVDVTNYVMLELGQPMHAFDLDTLDGGIVVRASKQGERIALLDGSEQTLDNKTMVIADHRKPLAIAGVMGGLDSSVTLLTKNILLESAFFTPTTIAKQRQQYNLSSESAYRFERGIDPTIQRQAIERATALILEIVGGEAGPIIEKENKTTLPKRPTVSLAAEKITQVLGMTIPIKNVDAILKGLGFTYQRNKTGWKIKIPPYRFDIDCSEDIIEEIARIYGYDKIPTEPIVSEWQVNETIQEPNIRQILSDLGYQEIISYSFINKKHQTLLDPDEAFKELLNPISNEMSVMRTTLWAGLLNTLIYNQSRQQQRVRLFELGHVFKIKHDQVDEKAKLAGLISGFAYPEQWGTASRDADFYDLKGDIKNILAASHFQGDVIFKPDTHPALHPGQTAGLYVADQKVGILGALHPQISQTLDIQGKVFLFELDLSLLKTRERKHYQDISKFPEIRRDIAILVNQAVPSKDIQDTIKVTVGDWLKDVFIFDVYQGKGISPGHKSIALALILQHPSRTLVDEEINQLMDRVLVALKGKLGAELRS